MAASPPAPAPLLNPPQWPDRYGPELYQFAYRRVRQPDAAAELVQETFLSALAARASFRGAASERTWLFAILRRKLIDFYRQQARQPVVPLGNLASQGDDEPLGPLFGEDGHWLPAHAPQPWPTADEALEQQELRQILAACQGRLPARQQLVFARRFVEEASAEEVCEELSLSAANFWVLVHRAKLSLRRCLERHWLAPPPYAAAP